MTKPFRNRSVFGALMLVFILFGTSSCEKYSSPRKVKRIITQGTWALSSAFIDNANATADYSAYQFRFKGDGDIVILGDPTVTGIWRTGLEKNPTYLSITITPFLPFYHLNADWEIIEITSDRIMMQLNGGSAVDVLIFTQVATN
ncbi:MAG: hypothetical protein ACI865_000861 [Flavobacteriaceae bacterium]|jgi:hypothetical protein